MAVATDNLPLIEPVPIDDDLCTGLAAIETISAGIARFVFFSRQTMYETGTEMLVVKRKIVQPVEAIALNVEMAIRFLAHCDEDRWSEISRLMK